MGEFRELVGILKLRIPQREKPRGLLLRLSLQYPSPQAWINQAIAPQYRATISKNSWYRVPWQQISILPKAPALNRTMHLKRRWIPSSYHLGYR
jgi:hypothetical protein